MILTYKAAGKKLPLQVSAACSEACSIEMVSGVATNAVMVFIVTGNTDRNGSEVTKPFEIVCQCEMQ